MSDKVDSATSERDRQQPSVAESEPALQVDEPSVEPAEAAAVAGNLAKSRYRIADILSLETTAARDQDVSANITEDSFSISSSISSSSSSPTSLSQNNPQQQQQISCRPDMNAPVYNWVAMAAAAAAAGLLPWKQHGQHQSGKCTFQVSYSSYSVSALI